MSVIFIALPVAIALAGGALLALAWAVREGQFDDVDTPSIRMLYDDEGDSAPRRPDVPATRDGDPRAPR